MIRLLLQPLVCERFLTDARYREGHLRVVNALLERLNCRCGEFHSLYNYDSNQETEEQRLIMARYTPSFHQKLLQYVVLDELGAEYKWRGR